MIYMVDHVFGDPAVEPAWHEWYAGYLVKLIAVPGIRSAQRFKAIGCSPSRFLAMYTVDSADVFTSAAYKSMGGGGSQSARFHGAYRLWTRNLFVAAGDDANHAASIRAPAVKDGERVLVFDREERPPRRFAPPLLSEGGDGSKSAVVDATIPLPSSSRKVERDRDSDRGRGGGGAIDDLEYQATWIESVGLHMTTRYRAFVVLDANAPATAASVPGSYLYEPFTQLIS